jgi:hypothetical protein
MQAGIEPVVDPSVLETSVYQGEGVLSVASVFAANQSLLARDPNETCQTMVAEQTSDENIKMGESYAARIVAVKSNLHTNRDVGPITVKVVLSYTTG